MPKRKPLINKDGGMRELSTADIKRMRPAREVLPASLRAKLGVRGPQRAPTKQRITIRLSSEVVEQFRATGDGWQTRVDSALQDWLKSHSPTRLVGR